jgi:hypothetical protein
MFTLGNCDEIQTARLDALTLAEALGDELQQMHLLAGLSIALSRTGDFRGAVSVGARSLPIAQRLGTAHAIAVSEWMLGVALHLASDQAAAQIHLLATTRQGAAHPTSYEV